MGEDLPREEPLSLGQLARLRQGVYRVLGMFFLYPDAEWMKALPPLAEALRAETQPLREFAFWGGWERLLGALAGLGEEDRRALEVVYATDFMNHQGHAGCAPYASVYARPDQVPVLLGDLDAFYAGEGFSVSPGVHQTPDHASVQFEFLGRLCAQEAGAWEEEAAGPAIEKLRREEKFLRESVLSWFPLFGRVLAHRRPGHFYGLGCAAAEAFAAHELDLIPALIGRFER